MGPLVFGQPVAVHHWPDELAVQHRLNAGFGDQSIGADRWAGNADDPHRANPVYQNFGDGGGDCTNFASQVMRAGGMKDEGDGVDDWHRGDADDWYYDNGFSFPGNTNSNTWSVAQANRDFVVNSGRGQVVGTSPMPANGALDPLAPSKAGLVPGDLIYYHDEATGTINHTAVYVGQKMQNGVPVDIVNQHAYGDNNFHDDWMPDHPGFTGGSASVEFVHLSYPESDWCPSSIRLGKA